jgi:HTH-type transcriptional repressor of NAD biosynthesis genes
VYNRDYNDYPRQGLPEWVEDGYRQHGDESDREQNNDYLKNMLTEKGFEYKSIKGNYQQRLEQSMLHVDRLLLTGGLI